MIVATHSKRLIFTVEDLPKLYEAGILEADARTELLNGEIYLMSPINYPHAYCVNILTNFFGKQLPNQFFVATQNPIMLNAQTLLEPDLAIYEREALLARRQHPTPDIAKLLIEVADTTYARDREQKLPLYAQSGIAQVWIVNLGKRVVEVYEKPSGNEYASLDIYYEHQILPTPFCLELNVQSLFLPEDKK